MNTVTLKNSLSRIACSVLALSMMSLCPAAHADEIINGGIITLNEMPRNSLLSPDNLFLPNDVLQSENGDILDLSEFPGNLDDDPILTPIGDPGVGTPAEPTGTQDAAVTPEPSSLALLGTGLASLSGLVHRRRKQSR